jgi:PEP-CTERM motif
MRVSALLSGFALVAVACAPAVSRADTISTVPTDYISSWGEPLASTPTYGQTITADPRLGLYLDAFTFYIQNYRPGTITYNAYIYEWTGTSVTGPALFTSGPFNLSPTGSTYRPVTTSTLGMPRLTAGQQYGVLLSTLGVTGADGDAHFLTAPESAYTGGTFIFTNSSDLYSSWEGVGVYGDLAFLMTFSQSAAVPEPASLTLVGVGLAALCARRWRRRNAP